MGILSKTLSVMFAGMLLMGTPQASENRTLPVAYEVDVVVAGGGCGAVAAAVEAAQKGQKVLLVTPRNYLGEDMVGSFRLWLEKGEVPQTNLARAVFHDELARPLNVLKYQYRSDRSPVAPGLDTTPPSKLANKAAEVEPLVTGVVYEGPVVLDAELESACKIRRIELCALSRKKDFQAGEVGLETSMDGKNWKSAGKLKREDVGGLEKIVCEEPGMMRYARIKIGVASDAKRLFLGRLSFYPAQENPVEDSQTYPVRPLHVKMQLEKALRDAGVQFLFSCYPTELLLDAQGNPAGVVMANGMGRQAIAAKVVIDATETAVLARLAGAEFQTAPVKARSADWFTIAAEERTNSGLQATAFPYATYQVLPNKKKPQLWHRYRASTDIVDTDWPGRAQLEDMLRDKSYVPDQLYTCDTPFMIPQSALKSAAINPASWTGAKDLPLEVCRPARLSRLWVLGGCAGVTREQAEKILRPVELMQLGERVGLAAAQEAQGIPLNREVVVAGAAAAANSKVEAEKIHEPSGNLRPIKRVREIKDSTAPLPVWGKYDVVVIGGGTSGAPAGIAAARQGARTLVIEHLYGLGGVGTLGMIGGYWYGNRVGFTATVPQNPIEVRMEFYRSELRKTGGDIWLGSIGYGAVMEGQRVTGVVVATPQGRGVVLAGAVIDGTGNSDLAAAAGAQTRFVDDFFAMQTTLVPLRKLGLNYVNGDCPAVDMSDPLDVTQAFSTLTTDPKNTWRIYGYKFTDVIPGGSQRREGFFDLGQSLGSRERRRIVGDFTLDWLDQITERTFPDSIAYTASDFDSHGYEVHPYFMLKASRPKTNEFHQYHSYVPYRCLLPKNIEGILVIGLGLSATRDAMPIIRMQPDLHNVGYAAGLAAAQAIKNHQGLREIDIRQLQDQLVKIGNLDKAVLEHQDSFPLSLQKIQEAVDSVGNHYNQLEIVMSDPARSLPLLRKAYDAAQGEQQLCYAHVLGIMGDAHGLKTLQAEAKRRIASRDLSAKQEADGKDRVTQLIWAIGRTGSKDAVATLCELGENLSQSTSSDAKAWHGDDPRNVYYRALAVSLGSLRDPAGGDLLSKMLQQKRGEHSAEEIIAACGLWRCGDRNGEARKVLEEFAAGNNGPFSRLAWTVLQSVPASPAVAK